MVQITVEEMSSNLLAYLQRVQAGESFVVTSAGKPIAEIKPAQSSLPDALIKLRQICEEESYALDLVPRVDRSNSLLDN